MTVSEASHDRSSSDEDYFMKFTAVLDAELQYNSRSPALQMSPLGNSSGRLTDLLERLRRSNSSSTDTEAMNSNDGDSYLLQQSLRQVSRIEASMDPQIPHPDHVTRALDCAFVILYNLVVLRIPYRCWQNQQAVKRLYDSVRSIEDETHANLLYHWLWM